MRPIITTALDLLGVSLFVAGVALLSVAVALMVAGAGVVFISVRSAQSRPLPKAPAS